MNLLSVRRHKSNQGRLPRQLTAVCLSLIVVFGAYTMSQSALAGFVVSFYRVTVTIPKDAGESDHEKIRNLADKLGTYSLSTEELTRRLEACQSVKEVNAVVDELRSSDAYHVNSTDFDAGVLAKRILDLRVPVDRGSRTAADGGLTRTYDLQISEWWEPSDTLRNVARTSGSEFIRAVEKLGGDSKVRMSVEQTRDDRGVTLGLPLLLAVVGLWSTWRAIHFPRFADFLVSVEAEIDKVTWSGWPELKRATVVVLTTMLLLALFLFLADMFWQGFFRWVKILQLTS